MVGALIRLSVIAGLLFLSAPAVASVHSGHMSAELNAFQRPGAPLADIGVTLTPDPGWHTYWINPGDTGLPTDIRLKASGAAFDGNFVWPAPQRLVYDEVVTYGYDRPVTVLGSLATTRIGSGEPVMAHIEALVCSDACEPVTFDLKTTIRTRPAVDPLASVRAALPEQIDLKATYTYSGSTLRIGFTAPDRPDLANLFQHPQGVQVFSEGEQVLPPAVLPSISTRSQGFSVAAVDVTGHHASGPQAFVLAFPGGKSIRTLAMPGPVQASQPVSAVSEVSSSQHSGVAWAVLLAFTGGLVLNLMPCVFPVLSMKLLALTRGVHDHAHARREAVVYGAGVMASFIALVLLIEIARALGSAVGWGFQLQSPFVTAAMALLMLLIGLNLSGLFEIGGTLQSLAGGRSHGSHPDVSAFLTGVLAVMVAAPCSAPFMATATGLALAQGGWTSMAIFAALGAGFAAPFVVLTWLLTALPGLSRFLPRPGPWMDVLRKLLAVPMYLSAVWMAWVFWQQASVAGVVLLVAGLGVIALALALRRLAAGARVTIMAAGLLLGMWGAFQPHVARQGIPAGDGRTVFSVAQLAALRAQDRPVLVDFTAAWCITCKVNERVALSDPSVKRALKDTHTLLMVADWTRRDAAITAFLSGFGRSGVPLYLYYGPESRDAVVLPQILTPSAVESVVRAQGTKP